MVWFIVIVIILVVVVSYFSRNKKCSVCSQPIKNKFYTWEIEGKKAILCPHCNSRMEKKVSKESFSRRFG